MTETESKNAATLEKFIDGLGLTHFKGKEFTWYWDRTQRGVKNTVPPSDLWPNIVPTMRVLDFLRKRADVPLFMTSTYRSPRYNKVIDGASESYHTKFQAVDFYSNVLTPRQLHETLRTMRAAGVFKGGLGLYKTFVHVDTRGYNADWKGKGV